MQDLSSSITFAVKLLQKLLYKASVKTFVKHRPISCSKERKPRNKILLTSVWDVTKTRNGDRRTSTGNGKLKKWEQGRELEIKSLFPFFIFPFPILFPSSPFPVPRSPWYPLRLNQSILWGQNLVVLLRFMAHASPGYCAQRHSMQRCTTSSRRYIIGSLRFRLTSTTFLPHFLIFHHNSTKETVANNAGDDKYAIDCCYNNVSWNRHV